MESSFILDQTKWQFANSDSKGEHRDRNCHCHEQKSKGVVLKNAFQYKEVSLRESKEIAKSVTSIGIIFRATEYSEKQGHTSEQ
jgi:hypothetical protein